MNLRTLSLLFVGLSALVLAAPHSLGFEGEEKAGSKSLEVHYLEIVTSEVESTCAALEQMHGVTFGEPVASFGSARTAALAGGGRLGVRAPMRASENPVVRPYLLVADIEAAVKAAEEAGAVIALPPVPIPGEGKFAIYIHGGIEHGLWQN